MTVVLDTSAFLAVIFKEPGRDVVIDRFGTAAMSSVNLGEVVAKLVERGADETQTDAVLASVEIAIHSHDAAQARAAGLLRATTRSAGLSLGDRACLALALSLDAPVLTADRSWADLDIDLDIEVIR